MGPRAGLRKISPPPHRIRSPDRPVRSKSLYRLSYCSPSVLIYTEIKLILVQFEQFLFKDALHIVAVFIQKVKVKIKVNL